jgi:predicted permease
MFEPLRQDAKYTIRGLRNSPAFTLAVVITLALGVGANAAMFTLVDRLLFRAPPHLIDPASTGRVYLYRTSEGHEDERSGQYARYVDLVRWTSSFMQAAAAEERPLPVGTGDDTRQMPVAVVSASFFGFFDAPARLGRYFTFYEDSPPVGAAVAVLTDAAWKSRYGGRRDVLGTSVEIGPKRYTIVGVAPAGFVGLWPDTPPVAFIPVSAYGATSSPEWWSSYGHAIGIDMIVRRKPGVSVATANADVTAALRRSYQHQLDEEPGRSSVTLASLRPRGLVASILTERGPEASSIARVALWLSGVAAVVLLIACANVANLLLAHALGRRREVAVRVALGVSRARLVSQSLIESLTLAVVAGAAGMLVAAWASAVLHAVFLPGAERPPVIADARTGLFAALLALCAGVLAGIVPALHVGRGDLTDALKAGVRESAYQRSRVRVALLVGQGALSVALLVGAGLFVSSLRNVQRVHLGYDADPVLVVDVNMRGVKLDSARRVALNRQLLAAAVSVPGVDHASLMKTVPFEGISSWALYVAGIDSVDRLGEFDLNGVSPEYFVTMGTRIVRGRGIEAADGPNAPLVMVVGASMAAALWPGQDPIGKCVRVKADTAPCTTVVGVAEDIHVRSLGDQAGHFLYYLAAAQMTPAGAGLFVRGREGRRLLAPVQRRLQAEMPGASYVTVKPLADIVASEARAWSAGATVFTVFGTLALLLAALGLYSVIAYSVAQRTHELGVRMALGARALDIVRLVTGEAVRFGAMGLAIGGGIGLAVGHWVGPLLFNESPRDPVVFGAVAGALFVVTIVASWIPASRATRVDPKTALHAG